MISPVAKNKNVDSNSEIQNTSIDFSTLNFPKESISTYGKSDESELEKDFFTHFNDYDTLGSDISPWKVFL